MSVKLHTTDINATNLSTVTINKIYLGGVLVYGSE